MWYSCCWSNRNRIIGSKIMMTDDNNNRVTAGHSISISRLSLDSRFLRFENRRRQPRSKCRFGSPLRFPLRARPSVTRHTHWLCFRAAAAARAQNSTIIITMKKAVRLIHIDETIYLAIYCIPLVVCLLLINTTQHSVHNDSHSFVLFYDYYYFYLLSSPSAAQIQQ